MIDIGPATAACLAFTIHYIASPKGDSSMFSDQRRSAEHAFSAKNGPAPPFPQTIGGIAVGNRGTAPHEVGLQFWAAGPRPLSAGGGLEAVSQLFESDLSRPTRSYGRMHRFRADRPYLATIAEHYHALRPLRVAVDSASKPWLGYLQTLFATVACEIVPERKAAHFGVQIDGDGETCRVSDEQGRGVPPERLRLLLAKLVPLTESRVGQAKPSPTSSETNPQAGYGGARLRLTHPTRTLPLSAANGPHPRPLFRKERGVLPSPPLMKTRAEVSAVMRANRAALGFGPGARYWHSLAGAPLPDALLTVTWLLKILSRGDEPLSQVLDREVPAG